MYIYIYRIFENDKDIPKQGLANAHRGQRLFRRQSPKSNSQYVRMRSFSNWLFSLLETYFSANFRSLSSLEQTLLQHFWVYLVNDVPGTQSSRTHTKVLFFKDCLALSLCSYARVIFQQHVGLTRGLPGSSLGPQQPFERLCMFLRACRCFFLWRRGMGLGA